MSRIASRLWANAPRAARRSATPIALRSRVRPAAAVVSAVAGPSRLTAARSFHASSIAAGPYQFKLADIGEGITEVEIIKWMVKVGDTVEEFDSLCEVQSDKSVVEITSPYSGKVESLAAEPGKVVKVGQTLCEIDRGDAAEDAEEAVEHEEEAAESAPSEPPAPEPRREAPPTPAPAAATLPSSGVPPKRAPKPHPLSDTAVRFEGEASVLPQPPPQQHNIPDSVEARREGSYASGKQIVKTSPAVRALAGRLGIELDEVKPTGPGGRVTREDVENFSSSMDASSQPPAQQQRSAPAPAPTPAQSQQRSAPPPPVHYSADRGEATERMEMGRTRKVMYKAMGSMGDVPHFGYQHNLNLTNLLPLMKAANAQTSEPKGYIASDVPQSMIHPAPTPARAKTSVLAFLVKALSLALEEHPIMRARVKTEGEQRYLEVSRDANIGIAVSDPKLGLLTPSLSGLDPSSSVSQVNNALSELRAKAARPGPLPHVTLSSVGPLGESRAAMPVLPPGGGLAIAAVGRAAWETEWVLRDGGARGVWNLDPSEVERAGTKAVLKCPVAWSGDHRVLEGAELIAFTETWKRFVEEPWRWMEV